MDKNDDNLLIHIKNRPDKGRLSKFMNLKDKTINKYRQQKALASLALLQFGSADYILQYDHYGIMTPF